MYFVLSKILGLFASPTNIISFFGLLGLALMIFRRRAGRVISVLALAALLLTGLSPLGNMLLTPLEQRFPGMNYPERVDGIIVLGGSYDTEIRSYLSTIVLGEDTEPMTLIANLARRYPGAKIIFSGGSEELIPGMGEAAIARQFFISFGIAAERITIEDQSRNTEENARFTSRLVKPTSDERWLLVTSAYHVPRAIGAFRRFGFNVDAFPAGWRTHGWRDFYWPADRATENLRRVDIATHEWVGLTIYRLLGYSSELFPARTPG
jgi:uncharacterized SAM-binding protein YcdF (DUF218 family)